MPGPGSVGERVRDLRLTRRMSQAQLAGHDLSDSYISLIESGKRTPTPAVLKLLSERLGCTPEYLSEGIEPEQRAHIEVLARHCELALHAGRPEDALRGFDEVIAADDNPELTLRARWGRARALERLGRATEAIAGFEDLREVAERDAGRTSWLPSVIALTRCYHAVGDLGQAVSLGERALARLTELGLTTGPDLAEVARVLLLAHLDRADTDRARELTTLLPDDCDVAEAYYQASRRALAESALGDAIYLAEQALSAAATRGRDSSRARLRVAGARALVRGDGQDNLRALDLLTAAAPDLNGDEATACVIESARALVQLGRLDEAVTTLRRTLGALPRQLDPIAVQAQLVLAAAQLAQRDTEGALAVLRTTAAQLERLPASRHTASLSRELGDLFDAAGDGSAATTAYRRALESVGLRPTQRATQAFAQH
ncbi:transcriptional regulator with XRE-family HTH domain [Actinocorallia herbida]|uniref:Transcriptional regulator with XRE-family HTH domain n=1 Tax=Actinocorallia herbida TaxID=58109 RepID=A0A3N1DBB4_9ACTN|nr:helix-turn-helix transcriptional regulator [Actinocorallia herbida]ROO90756.1 transcriptional regulator with XRE-family HTH domain [Actinocorallia herbida]